MQDKPLTCRDCGTTFLFTIGEQEAFAAKGYSSEPGRCPACRETHRRQRETPVPVSQPEAVSSGRDRDRRGGGSYSGGGNRGGANRGGAGSGGGYRGGTSSGGASSGERGQRAMFPVVCSQCGKQTTVPFQPRSERPVYCSDCFRTKQSAPQGAGRAAPSGASRGGSPR